MFEPVSYFRAYKLVRTRSQRLLDTYYRSPKRTGGQTWRQQGCASYQQIYQQRGYPRAWSFCMQEIRGRPRTFQG